MNYFIIPGNPPAVHFYEQWGKEIIAKEPTAKVRVSHYPRLAKNPNSESAMKEVLTAHREQLIAFYNETNSPISIIGHSLGGNIGLKILHEDMNEVIKKVILLHPFLRSPEKNGHLILKAAAFFYGKETLQSALIKNRKFLEYLSKDLPHVTNEEIEKSFHLAKHESITIATDRSPINIHQEKRDKVSVFYSLKDTWCTVGVIKELREQVKLFECSEPHDFITSQLHRQSLFAKILTTI
jgi:esterase/lipase